MASRTFEWKKLLKTPAQRRAEEEQARLAAELEANAKKEAQAKKRAEAKAKREAKKAEEEAKKKAESNTPKARATAAGEPWVNVLHLEIDPNDPSVGAFELDWNDKFVANLIRAGYQGKTDADIVDNWFQNICRNVALETYEQFQADPSNRPNNRRDLGNGRTEVS